MRDQEARDKTLLVQQQVNNLERAVRYRLESQGQRVDEMKKRVGIVLEEIDGRSLRRDKDLRERLEALEKYLGISFVPANLEVTETFTGPHYEPRIGDAQEPARRTRKSKVR